MYAGVISHQSIRSGTNLSLLIQFIADGALVYRRSREHAQDNSSSLHAVKEFLYAHSHIDRFALFQCTSVFLKARYIREAVDKFKQNPCVFAVTR